MDFSSPRFSCANADKRAKVQIFHLPSHGRAWEFESTIESASTLSCLTLMAVKNLFKQVLFHYGGMNDECRRVILLHKDDYGNSILHYFALRNNRVILDYFAKECKKLNVLDIKNNAGQCPSEILDAGRILMCHAHKHACPFWLCNDGCTYAYCQCKDQDVAPDETIRFACSYK